MLYKNCHKIVVNVFINKIGLTHQKILFSYEYGF